MARRVNGRTILVGLAALGGLGLVLWWARHADLLHTLRGIDWRLAALGLMPALLSYGGKALRYRLVLGREVGLRRTFGFAIAQNLIDQLVPLRAGDISYLVMVRSTGTATLGYAFASLLLLRLIDLIVLWAMYVASLPFLALGHPGYMYAGIIIGGLLTVGVALALVVVFAVDHAAPWGERLLAWLCLMRFSLVQKAWGQLVEGARNLRPLLRPRRLAAILATSALIWAASVWWNLLTWQAVGAPLNLRQMVFLTSISYFITVLPIFVFSGIGPGDLVKVAILCGFGLIRAEAAAWDLCVLALSMLYQLFFAALLPAVLYQRRTALRLRSGP